MRDGILGIGQYLVLLLALQHVLYCSSACPITCDRSREVIAVAGPGETCELLAQEPPVAFRPEQHGHYLVTCDGKEVRALRGMPCCCQGAFSAPVRAGRRLAVRRVLDCGFGVPDRISVRDVRTFCSGMAGI